MGADFFDRLQETAAYLRKRGVRHVDIGLILGSGLTAVEDLLVGQIEITYADIPHLRPSGAPGHHGILRYGKLGDLQALIFSGRLHYYEGYSMSEVTYPMRIMQALEVPRVLITAAVGGLNADLAAGDIVAITDHINLMPENPLRGLSDPRLGERFPDLSDAYSQEWRDALLSSAQEHGIPLKTGIYAGLAGPSLETQAECEFLRRAGADVVGMSVIPEVVVGVQAGMQIAAFCVVTNMSWHPGTRTGAAVADILEMAGSTTLKLRQLIAAFFFAS
jgi:purine-nucleoside phosphorylase